MKDPFIAIISIATLAAFLAGMMAGPVLVGRLAVCPGQEGSAFRDGWKAAEKRLDESGFFPALEPEAEYRTVSGQVTEAGDGRFAVKIRPLTPLADPALDRRIVRYGQKTETVKVRPLTPEEYAAAQAESDRKMMEAQAQAEAAGETGMPLPPILPPLSKEEPFDPAGIRAGDQVSATAAAGIKEAADFEAVKIVVMRMDDEMPPATPPAPITPAPVE